MISRSRRPSVAQSGFTLVEIAIVLVIIGLIVGAILVGRDLIEAAKINAQIAQINSYNTAVHAFESRYDALPGDISDPAATRFGFAARGSGGADGIDGAGDGNYVIEGIMSVNTPNTNCGLCVPTGETTAFWSDPLGTNIGITTVMGNAGPGQITAATMPQWLPRAKLGNNNYVYVYSQNGTNYYGVSAVTDYFWSWLGSTPGATAAQAAAIDKKMDDGLPLSGSVTTNAA
jgi:prepilin-type N-terminal cleavage/methylation domain-containing protein